VFSKSFGYQSGDSSMLLDGLCEDEDVVEETQTTPSIIRSWKMLFIMVWKVEGEFVTLKHITRGLNSPGPWFMRNTAFHSSPSFI